MHLFVDKSFLEAAETALPLFFKGEPGDEQSPAALTHRGVSRTGEIAGPGAPPEESAGQVCRHMALRGCAGSAPQNGRWGSPAHCRAKPVGIPWGKGEVGLRKKPLATPRWLFRVRPITI